MVSACVARDTGGRTCAASGLDRYAARDPSGVPIRLGAGGDWSRGDYPGSLDRIFPVAEGACCEINGSVLFY